MKTGFVCAALVSALCACGGGDSAGPDGGGVAPDAGPADARLVDAKPAALACLGDSPAVADPVSITGLTKNILDDEVVPNVSIEAFRANDTSETSVISDAEGAFAVSIPTGGQAWDGYLVASEDDHADTYVYVPPLREDFADVDLPILTPIQLRVVAALAEVSLDEAKGLIVVYVLDCDRQGIEGAVVAVDPQPEVLAYIAGDNPSTTAGATDVSGAAVALNADPGDVSITVSYEDIEMSADVRSVAGALTIAVLFP